MRIYVQVEPGLLGSNVIRQALLQGQQDIIASLCGLAPVGRAPYQLDSLDLNDHGDVRSSIRRVRPDVIIHCAALRDQVMMHQQRATALKQRRFLVEKHSMSARH